MLEIPPGRFMLPEDFVNAVSVDRTLFARRKRNEILPLWYEVNLVCKKIYTPLREMLSARS